MMRRGLLALAAVTALLATAACSDSDGGTDGKNAAATSPNKPGKPGKPHHIAFFGFAKANSFAAATYAGVQQYAEQHHATAQFFDPNFDAQAQVRQMQDAITSKRFDIFVVQANDGAAVVPQVRAALKAGITVVAEFTPVGTRYDTTQPQVPGSLTLIDVPTGNGRALGRLGVDACRSLKVKKCQVAYLEGLKSLPLDNARTKAVEQALKKGGSAVHLASEVEGGYTQQSGRKAMQDVLQAVPDVNVVIGSSQAIAGAQKVAGGKHIAFVGNGASRQAVEAVRKGKWFATYYVPPKTMGARAAQLGMEKADGKKVQAGNDATPLAPNGGLGTPQALKGVTGEYDE
jgi:ribose transport system substrate-binding protein